MTTASTTPDADSEAEKATRELIKKGTHRIFKGVMRFAVVPVLLIYIAQLGWVVGFNIWAPSLWWLLPLGALITIMLSFVHDALGTAREDLLSLDWDRFSKHPFRAIKAYWRNRASDAAWPKFRKMTLKKIRNRIFCLLVPAVLFASLLFLIFMHYDESIWVFMAGNHNYGQNGFGWLSIVIVYIVAVVAVDGYWRLLRQLRRIADGERLPYKITAKIVVFTALTTLAFVPFIGCSIVINSGS
jgi:hypothetical protein